jgi:hypothetical protein
VKGRKDNGPFEFTNKGSYGDRVKLIITHGMEAQKSDTATSPSNIVVYHRRTLP